MTRTLFLTHILACHTFYSASRIPCVLIRGPSVWIERLSSPINPLPFASPLSSQVAALRSYHTRVCGTDSAHLSSPFGSSTRPLSLCSLRSPRTLHADGAPLLPRVLSAQRRTLPVWYAELDPSRKLSPAGDTRLKAACLHSRVKISLLKEPLGT